MGRPARADCVAAGATGAAVCAAPVEAASQAAVAVRRK